MRCRALFTSGVCDVAPRRMRCRTSTFGLSHVMARDIFNVTPPLFTIRTMLNLTSKPLSHLLTKQLKYWKITTPSKLVLFGVKRKDILCWFKISYFMSLNSMLVDAPNRHLPCHLTLLERMVKLMDKANAVFTAKISLIFWFFYLSAFVHPESSPQTYRYYRLPTRKYLYR